MPALSSDSDQEHNIQAARPTGQDRPTEMPPTTVPDAIGPPQQPTRRVSTIGSQDIDDDVPTVRTLQPSGDLARVLAALKEAAKPLPPQSRSIHAPASALYPLDLWEITAEAALQRHAREPARPLRWVEPNWFERLVTLGYRLFKMASDYLIFPGCSLLLTGGEWLLGKAPTEQFVIALAGSIPLTELLPLFEPVVGGFGLSGSALGQLNMSPSLESTSQASLLAHCTPSQLQEAYKIQWANDRHVILQMSDPIPGNGEASVPDRWANDRRVILQMSRRQVADILVDLSVQNLKEQAISVAFGNNSRVVEEQDLAQKDRNRIDGWQI